jgi:Heterokaryon incompatibility protein (HET)
MSDIRLPTRLIDVGDDKHPSILRLDTSKSRSSSKYIALSHRWGNPSAHRVFSTYRSNIRTLERHIDFDQLPQTFQDAVTTTRNLGVRYLWIDSLCIIQEDEEDWKAESKLMEDVFSFSYCTIAASTARGSDDGFIKPQSPRKCVRLQDSQGSTFYVCEAVDDFRSDVELGDLNKRGWVFQERALSRRTIYFTKTQVYWECGKGVQCETLTKMSK